MGDKVGSEGDEGAEKGAGDGAAVVGASVGAGVGLGVPHGNQNALQLQGRLRKIIDQHNRFGKCKEGILALIVDVDPLRPSSLGTFRSI